MVPFLPFLAGGGALAQLAGQFFGGDQNQEAMDDWIRFMNRRTKKAEKLIDQYSGQEIADTQRDWDNRLASSQQDLVSRGLTNSSLLADNTRGWMEGREADVRRARNSFLDRKLQAYLGTTGATGAGIAGWPASQGPNYGALSDAGRTFGLSLDNYVNQPTTVAVLPNNAGATGPAYSSAPPPRQPWRAWSNYKVTV